MAAKPLFVPAEPAASPLADVADLSEKARWAGVSLAQLAACQAMEALLEAEARASRSPWNVGRLEGAADRAAQAASDLKERAPALSAAERFFFALALRDLWPDAHSLTHNLPGADQTAERKARAKAACSRVGEAFSRAEKALLDGLDCERPVAFGFLPLAGALGPFGEAELAEKPLCPQLRRAAQIQGFFHLETLRFQRQGAFAIDVAHAVDRRGEPVRPEARKSLPTGSSQPSAPVAWPVAKSPPFGFWLAPAAAIPHSLRSRFYFRAQQAIEAGVGLAKLPARVTAFALVEMSDPAHGLASKADAWRFVRSRCGERALAERIEADGKAAAALPWLIGAFAGRPAQLADELQKMAAAFPPESDFWRPKTHPQIHLADCVSKLDSSKLANKALPGQIAEISRLLSRLGFKSDGSAPGGAKIAASESRPTSLFHWVDCPPAFVAALAPLALGDGGEINARAANGQTALGRLNARARSLARHDKAAAETLDAAMQLLVSFGANPASIAPAPDPVAVAATPAMARLVRVHLEKEELVQSLSEAELRKAIDFWRASQAAAAPAPAAPARKRL